jgi:ferredoxin
MACPVTAIQAIAGRYCIDANLCNECGKCIEECPTEAADCYVITDSFFSPEEQALWTAIPTELKKRA